MVHSRVNGLLMFLLFLFCLVPPAIFANDGDNDGDVVEAVELCDNGTLIKMQHAGMVAVLKEDVGEDIFQQVTSIAIMLLESGKPTGSFDPGYPTTACGQDDVMTITFLGMEK